MFCLQNKHFTILLILLTSFFSAIHSIQAATRAEQQTIDIKAQYLLLDDKKGISEYKGNVLFTKDSLIIKADTVILHYTKGKLSKAYITGSPADVQHQPENEAKVHSQANTMEFFVKEDRLVLKGQAFVKQGDRHFSGEYIEYNTQQHTITATGKKENANKVTGSTSDSINDTPSSNRVHVIIGPKDDNESNEIKDKIENE